MAETDDINQWWIYRGIGNPDETGRIAQLPDPPGWREFLGSRIDQRFGAGARGAAFQATTEEKDLINAALYLRRPLFITGKPGCGKSSLAYAVAYELGLGPVLRWNITTRVTLQDGLYHYDAIGRLQDASLASKEGRSMPSIGDYIRLGPLGTALLPATHPRVLLIDEIDKSDIDLPNDLLNIFEEGEFDIPELARRPQEPSFMTSERQDSGEVIRKNEATGTYVMPYNGSKADDKVEIIGGHVRCTAFPFVVLTSNEEREFPPAFLRRCIRLKMDFPGDKKLTNIVKSHLGEAVFPEANQLIADFVKRSEKGDLATDQLLNAIYLVTRDDVKLNDRKKMFEALWQYLSSNTEGV